MATAGAFDGLLSAIEAAVEAVERDVAPALERAHASGIETRLSPLFKTPAEAGRGSPLFLDFVDDARLLVDRGAFFAGVLDRLRALLAALGARLAGRVIAP